MVDFFQKFQKTAIVKMDREAAETLLHAQPWEAHKAPDDIQVPELERVFHITMRRSTYPGEGKLEKELAMIVEALTVVGIPCQVLNDTAGPVICVFSPHWKALMPLISDKPCPGQADPAPTLG